MVLTQGSGARRRSAGQGTKQACVRYHRAEEQKAEDCRGTMPLRARSAGPVLSYSITWGYQDGNKGKSEAELFAKGAKQDAGTFLAVRFWLGLMRQERD